jgi:hypothetical protein
MKSDGQPRRFPRRRFLRLLTSGAALSALDRPRSATAAQWRPASAAKLPRWRGFDLTEKLRRETNKPYEEWDFDFLSAWGVDFVRLPLDYRIWRIGNPSGSFVLQDAGTLTGKTVSGTWFVVSGSGTGQLQGLRGKGGFTAELGQHAQITLDYWFEDPA